MTYDSATGDTSMVDFEDDMLNQFPWHNVTSRPSHRMVQSPMRNIEGMVDDDSAHPFASPRVPLASELDLANQDLSYAAARDHGISQGYHLFRSPPPPTEEPAPKTGWYVNAVTLHSGHAPGVEALGEEQQLKRKRHVKALMRYDPSGELKEQKKAVRRALAALDEVDATLPGDTAAIKAATDALQNDLRHHKSSGSRDTKLKQALVGGLPLHEAANEEARAKGEVQSLLRSDLYDVTSELADKWAVLQGGGEAARRVALERMRDKSQELHEQMVEVELRLTDHVLLGTVEEAERMLRAPGPDGALLRSLRRQEDALFTKQRQQKAVLVAVARKALETDTLHREEIASYGRRLLAADNTHEELVDAADQLKEACISVREAVGIAGSAAKPMVKPSASMPNAELPKGGTIETMPARSNEHVSHWKSMEVEVDLTSPALGLALARDDTLPLVDVFGDGTVRKQGAPGPPKAAQATVDLSRALVAVRVDPKSPFAKAVSTGDVLLAINDKPTSNISAWSDLSSLLEAEMGGAPSKHFKLELLRPTDPPIELTPAVPTEKPGVARKKSWFKRK